MIACLEIQRTKLKNARTRPLSGHPLTQVCFLADMSPIVTGKARTVTQNGIVQFHALLIAAHKSALGFRPE
jgi:hypothetical protein